MQRADIRGNIRCNVAERRQTCAVGVTGTHSIEDSLNVHEVEESLEHEYESEDEREVEIEWEYD